MHHVSEAPRTHVKSEVIATRTGIKIIRMNLPGGEALPVHYAPRDVSVVVVAGAGRITVADRDYAAEPGVVLESPAGVPHGIAADEALDVLVIQAP